MEQDEEKIDPNYVRGFNNGYVLARHEPELTAKLLDGRDHLNAYFKGFVSGKEQYDKEVNEWAKSFSRGERDSTDKERGKER